MKVENYRHQGPGKHKMLFYTGNQQGRKPNEIIGMKNWAIRVSIGTPSDCRRSNTANEKKTKAEREAKKSMILRKM